MGPTALTEFFRNLPWFLPAYLPQIDSFWVKILVNLKIHSGTTQQGAQQPPATENLRETNVELREENPKTSPENLINTFCGAP